MKTLTELYQEALDVQNASNLPGVAQSFARAMLDLGDHVKGTDERNTHTITVLWLDKMNSLARIQFDDGKIHAAYAMAFGMTEAR